MPVSKGEAVTPGQVLGLASELQCGPGTYKSASDHVHASVCGWVDLAASETGVLTQVSVTQLEQPMLNPHPGDTVTVRVAKVTPHFANVMILVIGSRPVKNHFDGMIRREDVRATEVDKVELFQCFRPGDVVRCRVISLGDSSRSYLLTTAENELGVVFARSVAGAMMVPVSWQEMQCPKTGAREYRKVAKVAKVASAASSSS